MIKYRETILLELERYPEKCNERGMEARCLLGYMDNEDMRDYSGAELFAKCGIKSNPNVSIRKENK